MSLGTECAPHRIPLQFCAACKGAAEERERCITKLKEFARILKADGQEQWRLYIHASDIIRHD